MKGKFLFLILGICIILYLNTFTIVKVPNAPIIVEYGNNFIQLDLGKDVKIEFDDFTLGTHKARLYIDSSEPIYFNNLRKECFIEIQVQDTIKPIFTKFIEVIETYKDVVVDLEDLYYATDYDKVKINIDKNNLNFSKIGTYNITVSASDTSGNIESKKVKVIVKQPVIKLNKNNIEIGVGKSLKLKSEVYGKSKTVKYTSSDNSIAEVNENGKVVGKQIGTATITATANGVSDVCKVTVQKTHKINSKTIIDIGYFFDNYDLANDEIIYNSIVLNNSRKIYFKGNVSNVLNHFYCITRYTSQEIESIFNIEVPYSNDKAFQDEGGRYLLISEDYFSAVKNRLIEKQNTYVKDRTIYRDTIIKALKGMDLVCSDKEMVNQINDWICKKISYKITNGKHYEVFSVYNYKGQCYHYAMLFNDMCRAVGIKSSYIDGDSIAGYHAWNSVTIDGVIYYFDST